MKPALPILALTAGDSGSSGPEILVKALAVAEVRQICRPLVIGSPTIIAQAAEKLHLGMKVRRVGEVSEARFEPDQVDIIEPEHPPDPADETQVLALRTGIRLAREGLVRGVVAIPLSLPARELSCALLQENAPPPAKGTPQQPAITMLVTARLRVVSLTGRIPTQDAITAVRQDRVLAAIRLTADALRLLGSPKDVIAVAGLNPSTGENRFAGEEETREILPAVETGRAAGLHVEGPLPPENVFLRATRGEFGAVIAMYHDQGHIAARMFASRSIVEIVLGMPFPFTIVVDAQLPGHAARGAADPAGMVEAIRLCAQMASIKTAPWP